MRYPQVTPQAFSIDLSRCADVRGTGSLLSGRGDRLDDREREAELPVAAIVLAPGAALFDPAVWIISTTAAIRMC